MVFFYVPAMMQFALKQNNKEEYHIKILSHIQYTQSYYDNTGRYLWDDIIVFLKGMWGKEIHDMDIDNYDKRKTYIWIHVTFNPDPTDVLIRAIIYSLEKFFENEIRPKLVPKLVTIVANYLNSSQRFFAESICEYQEKHGKERTLQCIDVYIRDIKSNLVEDSINF